MAESNAMSAPLKGEGQATIIDNARLVRRK